MVALWRLHREHVGGHRRLGFASSEPRRGKRNSCCQNSRMSRRSHLPWTVAGRVSEQTTAGDDVVRQTGWVFNNVTGGSLTIDEFVASGDDEVTGYLALFGLQSDDDECKTIVEVGAGIGRMTAAFTRAFGSVIACDLDAGLLERCRETVSRFGKVDRLQTIQVADGRTLDLPPNIADIAFSYITLQHCTADEALSLVAEAIRVVRPGGKIALNLRMRSTTDAVLVPAGYLVRGLFRLRLLGPLLARQRSVSRIGWQMERLHPDEVIGPVSALLADITVWMNPSSGVRPRGATRTDFAGVNRHHWWLIATVS